LGKSVHKKIVPEFIKCANNCSMKNLSTFLFILLFGGLLSCSESITPEIKLLDPPEFELPDPPTLREGCNWATAKLPVFNSKKEFVKFRYESCLGPESESVFVDHNGNDVTKLTFDVGDGGFSIFKNDNIEQEEFVQKMIQRFFEHDGICAAVKIEENVWKIDDGKGYDADINFMPCGRYGRNFTGETFFHFKGDVVFNFQMAGKWNTIDLSSVEYLAPSKID